MGKELNRTKSEQFFVWFLRCLFVAMVRKNEDGDEVFAGFVIWNPLLWFCVLFFGTLEMIVRVPKAIYKAFKIAYCEGVVYAWENRTSKFDNK